MVACHMDEKIYQHQPVLLAEVMKYIGVKSDGIYIDATFGRGGHAQVILQQLGSKGRLLAMDKDPAAVSYAKQQWINDHRFTMHHGSFAEMALFAEQQQVMGQVDGILFDLGVSSPQLDDPDRGFSFLREGKLDMRMDSSKGLDAASWLAVVSESALANVLWEYGEERYSRRIARAIVKARMTAPIVSTTQLAEIIAVAHPAWEKEKGRHPATRSFQAIRIAVNHELDDLQEGLKQSINVLRVGGSLLVMSFHSLEDRIAKHFLQDQERGESLPAGLPIKQAYFQSRLKRLGKAIKPTAEEVAMNPRARSAVLRIAEKVS